MTQPADDDISHLDFDFDPTIEPNGFTCDQCADTTPHGHAVPVAQTQPERVLGNIINPKGKEHAPTPDRPNMGRTVAAHSEKVEGDVYTVSFIVPAELQLHDLFDDMVHDEGLAHAHFKNLMPVGPTFSTVEKADDIPDYALQELARSMPSNLTPEQALKEAERLSGRKARKVSQILVTVSMQIGAQL